MITPAKLIRRIFHEKRAFTLIEVVIATSIFVIVMTMGVTIFVNVLRVQHRITLENAIYEDGRSMMERIAREIRYNTIDYEEYYNMDGLSKIPGPAPRHGQRFGCYAQQFVNPGSDGAFGALCNDGFTLANPSCVINKNTLDFNSGANPFIGNLGGDDSNFAHSRCDEANSWGADDCDPGDTDYNQFFESDELYLINSTGAQKTYFGSKQVNASPVENSVAMLKLDGQDSNTDGIYEQWEDITNSNFYDGFCSPGYDCDNTVVKDLTGNLGGTNGTIYQGFVPLTPLRTNVKSLKFYLSPLEDPRKAHAESTVADGFMQQPHVTIVMTLEPSDSELQSFAGDPPEITVQSTITTRVYNNVKSYAGVDECI